jgi:hypothetical protein
MIKNEQIAAVRAAIIKAVPEIIATPFRATADVVWVIATTCVAPVRVTKVNW